MTEQEIEHPEIDEPEYCGVIYDLSNERYHGHESVSKSLTDQLNKSPAHALAYKNGLLKRPDTRTFAKGTLTHCAVLEPDFLEARYSTIPEDAPRRPSVNQINAKNPSQATLDTIKWWSDFELENEGKELVSHDEIHMAKRIRDEVLKHPVASLLFDGGQSEVSIFSKLEGLRVRCRPDYLNGEICIDLKSTENASQEKFNRSVFDYRYYVQDPFYTDVSASAGLEISNFLFVAIEKSEPYGIGIFELDSDAVDYGRREYRANLETYKRCLDSGLWPCYEPKIRTLSLPRYAFDKIEKRIDEAA